MLSPSVKTVAIATSLVGLIAICVLAGWSLDVRPLKSVLPTLTTMKANTAICLGITAIAIWLSRTETDRRRNFLPICLLVGLVALTAGITASEYIFHWDAGIDQLIFMDVEHRGTAYPPGRFAPGTVVCLLLLSGALLTIDSWRRTSHGLTVATIFVALIGLIGYLYNLPTLYGAGRYTSLALHTIGCFLLLCTAMLACRPERGVTALLTTQASYTRFLAAGAVLLPILLGSLALHVQRAGGYGPEFTLALFSVLLIVLSVAIVWVTEGERQKLDKRMEADRALSASEERLRLALDSAAIGIWDSNPLTGKRHWDSRSRVIFGFPPDLTIDAQTILHCIHPEDRELVQRSVAEYINPAGSGRFEIEHRICTWNDGTIRYVFGQGRTMFQGEGKNRKAIRSVGTVQDITGLKQGEKELRRLNYELEQFAYAAAHDLQEPLRNVSLATQILASRYRGRFDDDVDVLLDAATEGPRRMLAMVKDLLAYSRVLAFEPGELPSVDSNSVLSMALEILQLSIQEKHARISFDTLPAVAMRESHLIQVFQNLISNSIKYCGDRKPEIHISSATRSGVCTFLVRDKGLGIPAEYRDRAFLMFKRLHGRSLPGTGIGLALCKRIVEYYGGKIWIESSDGPGITILFTPPLTNEAAPAAELRLNGPGLQAEE